MPRRLMFFILPFLSLSLMCSTGFAARKHSIYLSDGIGSSEHFRNVSGKYTRQGMPLTLTGAAFVTYRYAFSKAFSAGITAGVDNSSGRIIRRGDFNFSLPYGMLGAYERRAHTIAAELLMRYGADADGRFYSAAGVGYTFSNITLTYRADIYDEYASRVPNMLAPANPTHVNDSRIAYQLTLCGYRTADPLAVFVELGFGYKGLLHVGLSYEF